MLKLPSYQELSREQDSINNLPLNGSHLIVGPPGTGKTILALYRVVRLKATGKNALFLMFNQTLKQYVEQAATEIGVEGCVMTFHKWFYDWFPKTFHSRAPQQEAHIFDWARVYERIAAGKVPVVQYDHVIVDEGQDFPADLYGVLRLIAKNITVFADENQRITEYHSTIEQIQTRMGLSEIYWLTRNYRNNKYIAEFTRTFYAGLASGIPDPPERKGPRPRVVSTGDLKDQMAFIARYERNNADKDIAIFVATNKLQFRAEHMLKEQRTKNPVQMYVGNSTAFKKLNFHGRGIKILTYASSKGLDFDAVFLPDLDNRQPDPDSDYEKMRFYVMTSRAREELFLLFSGSLLPPVLQRVPPHLFELEILN